MHNKEKVKFVEERFGESLNQAAIRMYGSATDRTRKLVRMCEKCGRFCTNKHCLKCFRKGNVWVE